MVIKVIPKHWLRPFVQSSGPQTIPPIHLVHFTLDIVLNYFCLAQHKWYFEAASKHFFSLQLYMEWTHAKKAWVEWDCFLAKLYFFLALRFSLREIWFGNFFPSTFLDFRFHFFPLRFWRPILESNTEFKVCDQMGSNFQIYLRFDFSRFPAIKTIRKN